MKSHKKTLMREVEVSVDLEMIHLLSNIHLAIAKGAQLRCIQFS